MTLAPLVAPMLLLPILIGSESAAVDAPDPPRHVTVEITSTGYVPASITVRHGDVVRFIQRDGPAHNIAFHDAPAGAELAPEYPTSIGDVEVFRPVTPTARTGPFLIGQGRTYEIRIGDELPEGVYQFGCSKHERWRGLMIVEDFEELH